MRVGQWAAEIKKALNFFFLVVIIIFFWWKVSWGGALER